MVSALRPLVGDTGLLVAYEPTNSLIAAGTEAQLRRLLHLLRGLDDAAERDLRVVGVRYRDADEIASLATEVLEAEEPDKDGAVPSLVADPRTQSILIEGPRQAVLDAQALIRRLDVALPGRGGLHVVRLLNADPETLAEHLEGLGDGAGPATLAGTDYQVVVDLPTHSLIIRALPETFEELALLISTLDVPAPRVAVRLQVIEVSTTGNLTLGFDSLLPLNRFDDVNDGGAVVGTGEFTGLIDPAAAALVGIEVNPPDESFVARATRTPLLVPFGDALIPIGGGVQVRADQGEATFDSVVEPFMVMVSGEEHRIVAGDNVPVPVTGGGTATSALVTSVSIERQDTGVEMRVTPKVLSDRAVRIALELDVSDVTASSGDLGPTISQKQVAVDALLRDGEALVIAGLRDPLLTETVGGVPFLRRIPFLGWLFRTTSTQLRRRHLMVIAEASVLRSPAEDLAFSTQRRLASERELTRARVLAAQTEAPWALLVATRATDSEAREVADQLRQGAGEPQVVSWTWEDQVRFDVYLTGFGSVSEASRRAVALRADSWLPQLVPVLPSLRRATVPAAATP